MNGQQAVEMLRHSVVMRDGDPTYNGTVTEVGYTGFSVQWEDGTQEWVDYQAAQHIFVVPNRESKP